MVRYGTVGTSWIVDALIDGAREGAPEHGLNAVYSRRRETAEAFAAKHGVAHLFTDLEEMARSELIDAMYIASPNALHYPQAKLFLEHGKHVLCEKTCVVTSDQLADLYATADRKGVVFLEGVNVLHEAELGILEAALPRLGRIHLARLDFSRYSSKYPKYLAGENPNIFNPQLAAGALMDMGIYALYPAIYLFGQPKKVDASAVFLRTGADGAGAAVLGYDDKVVCVSYSKMSDAGVECSIQGDEGVLLIDTIEHLDNVRFVSTDGREEKLITRDTSIKPMGYEAKDFYDLITDPAGHARQYRRPRETAVQTIATIEEIRRSAGYLF